jgi:hypothetical protein
MAGPHPGKQWPILVHEPQKSPVPNSLVKSCDFSIDFCCYCGFVAAARKDKNPRLYPRVRRFITKILLYFYTTVQYPISQSLENESEVGLCIMSVRFGVTSAGELSLSNFGVSVGGLE